jgi:uncharacterized protein DUF1566
MKSRRTRSFALVAPTTLLLAACGADRLSVGAGPPSGTGGGQSGASSALEFAGSASAGENGARAEVGGHASGVAGTAGAAGMSISGAAGMSASGVAGTASGVAGTASAAGGSEMSSVVCDPGFANCDGADQNGCEVALTSTATCGISCADRVKCDVDGSAAACINGGCTSDWASWVMPNSPRTDPDAPHQAEYLDNGDGTVSDVLTGLVWQKANIPELYVWDDAMTYCAKLELASFSDWRLPSRLELVTIEELLTIGNSSSDQIGAFAYVLQPSTMGLFWSSTLVHDTATWAWIVGGPIYSARTKTEEKYVRCVR